MSSKRKRSDTPDPLIRRFEAAARRIARREGVAVPSITVGFLPNSELRRLKARFFKKPPPRFVDVLAFPEPQHFPHPEARTKVLGEVYLNQALRGERERMIRLLVHGTLHVCGYDHQTKRDTIRMEKREARYVTMLVRSKAVRRS